MVGWAGWEVWASWAVWVSWAGWAGWAGWASWVGWANFTEKLMFALLTKKSIRFPQRTWGTYRPAS